MGAVTNTIYNPLHDMLDLRGTLRLEEYQEQHSALVLTLVFHTRQEPHNLMGAVTNVSL